jgi:rhodanese-related sulfurtransferase
VAQPRVEPAPCGGAGSPGERVTGKLTAMSVREIGRDELRRKIESGEAFVLVDALAPMSYAHSHLPGAINLPPEWVDERAHRRIPDQGTEVVVYCASSTCDSSILVADRLVELGYRNVLHYTGGKREWAESGFPFEGGGVSKRR